MPIGHCNMAQGESGRRFKVGRSSSPVSVVPGPCPFWVCSVRVRKVGLPGALSFTLRANVMLRSRSFTPSNSEVVTMYSGRFGKIRAISFCAFSMRSGVGGWVETTFAMVPRAALLICLNPLEESDVRIRVVTGLVHILQAEEVRLALGVAT